MNRRESLPGKDQQATASVAGRRRLFGVCVEAAGIEPADERAGNGGAIEPAAGAPVAGCQAETQERPAGVFGGVACAGAVAFALLTACGWTEVWVAQACLWFGGAR